MHLGWEGGSLIAVGFFARGEAESMVAIEHRKLEGKAAADRVRAFWSARFEALAAMLKQ
jgi:hypothetical protein